jgi:hypothetical protein
LAQQHGEEAIKTLAELLDDPEPRVRAVAADKLLDRGYGRPPQAITGEDGGPVPVHLRELNTIEVARRTAFLLTAADRQQREGNNDRA